MGSLDIKTKVCLIAKSFDLNIGGIGRYAKELFLRINNKFEIIALSTKQTSSLAYLWFSAVSVALTLPKADVYHALSPIESIYICDKENSVVTIHDLLPILYLNLTKIRYAKGPVSRFLAKNYFLFACKRAIRCKKIIVNSELTKKQIIEYLGADESKIRVIPIGINPNLRPKNQSNKTFRIGTLSYLDQKKRINLLIDAFRKIREGLVDAELVIGGEGDDRKRLESLALDTDTKFVGFVPEKELCDFYNSLDLFVFPSINEGQGLPIIEAIACGKLVITLEDAIMPEEIKSHTIIATAENLSEVILKIKNTNCKQTQENIKWAQSHSLDEMARKTIEVYNEL
jgi:glycosyltransferase involved in cell wall biosynthesis